MHCLGRLSRRQCCHFIAELKAAGRLRQCAVAVAHAPPQTPGTASVPELAGDGPPWATFMPHSCWFRRIEVGSGGDEGRAGCQLALRVGVPSTRSHWSNPPTMPALSRRSGSQATASTAEGNSADHGSKAQQGTGGSSHAATDSATRSTAKADTEVMRGRAAQQSVMPELSSNRGSNGSGSLAEAGWTRQEVWNAPNAISMARLVSGPVIAGWIIAGEWQAALIALTISGTPQMPHLMHCIISVSNQVALITDAQ